MRFASTIMPGTARPRTCWPHSSADRPVDGSRAGDGNVQGQVPHRGGDAAEAAVAVGQAHGRGEEHVADVVDPAPPGHAVLLATQRTSVAFTLMVTSASSAGVPPFPGNRVERADASPLPCVLVVRTCELIAGGERDGWASGATWVELGDVHGWNAGTNDTAIGVPPPGRGKAARAPSACQSGSQSMAVLVVSLTWLVPSEFMRYSSRLPSRSLAKTIIEPSGRSPASPRVPYWS